MKVEPNELGGRVPGYDLELGRRLKSVIDTIGSQKRAGSIASVKPEMIAKYISGKAKPSFYAMRSLAQAADVSLDWLATGRGEQQGLPANQGPAEKQASWLPAKVQDAQENGFVMIPRYDVTASAGPGAFQDSEKVTDVLAFKADWVRRELRTSPEKLALITAEGDSMDPTIRPGDILLIDTSVDEIEQDSIYVVVIDGYVMVKRCQRLFRSGIVIKSDNPNYDEIRLGPDESNEFIVAGRVCWVGRMI